MIPSLSLLAVAVVTSFINPAASRSPPSSSALLLPAHTRQGTNDTNPTINFDGVEISPLREPGTSQTSLGWQYTWQTRNFTRDDNEAIVDCQRVFTANITSREPMDGPFNITNLNVSLLIEYFAIMDTEEVAAFSESLRVLTDQNLSDCTGIDNETLSFVDLAQIAEGLKSPDGVAPWVVGAVGGAILLVGFLAVLTCAMRSRNKIWNEDEYVDEEAYSK